MVSDKVVRFSVNPIELRTSVTDLPPWEPEDWYSMGCPRTLETSGYYNGGAASNGSRLHHEAGVCEDRPVDHIAL